MLLYESSPFQSPDTIDQGIKYFYMIETTKTIVCDKTLYLLFW